MYQYHASYVPIYVLAILLDNGGECTGSQVVILELCYDDVFIVLLSCHGNVVLWHVLALTVGMSNGLAVLSNVYNHSFIGGDGVRENLLCFTEQWFQ